MNRPEPHSNLELNCNPLAQDGQLESIPSAPTLAELYEEYSAMLLAYVHRRTGDVHVTEDLVADVFVDVARSLPKYIDRGVPIRVWLLRITSNAVNRRQRRQRPWITLKVEPAVEDAGPGEENAELRRAFLSLSTRFQDVLALHHFEGCSTQETAQILGCREGTVRSRLVRGRAKLKVKLERCGWQAQGPRS